ncbi:MAG: hypothetical protein AAF388_05920 [Bacteroidota bacterium]
MENQASSTSSFSKFFAFLVSIFMVLSVLGFAVSWVFEKMVIYSPTISGASKVNRILTYSNENEIPILGSSRAEASYHPTYLGDQFYNYGIAGSDARVWIFFLEQELLKDKATPIIINFDMKGFTSSIGDEGNYIPNFPKTQPILESKAKTAYYFPFIKYFGWYESYLKYYINEKNAITKYIDRGATNEKNIPTRAQFQAMIEKRKKTASKFHKNDAHIQTFHELISSTERKLYVVIAPYHSSYFEQFENPEELDSYLNSLSRFDNVAVIDLRSFADDETEFFDTTHLNYKGAIRFSKKLKELLGLTGGAS